jgi:Ni/Fe-hydrogenase subunit HybB-like protein
VVKLPEIVRKRMYAVSGCLALIGIFAMRWNVVIGGQLFSKSFLGYTTYKMRTRDQPPTPRPRADRWLARVRFVSKLAFVPGPDFRCAVRCV